MERKSVGDNSSQKMRSSVDTSPQGTENRSGEVSDEDHVTWVQKRISSAVGSSQSGQDKSGESITSLGSKRSEKSSNNTQKSSKKSDGRSSEDVSNRRKGSHPQRSKKSENLIKFENLEKDLTNTDWLAGLRSYRSEPIFTAPFEKKFIPNDGLVKVPVGTRPITQKFVSAEDVHIIYKHQPELLKSSTELSAELADSNAVSPSPLSQDEDEKNLTAALNTTLEELSHLESSRFSFYDELWKSSDAFKTLRVQAGSLDEIVASNRDVDNCEEATEISCSCTESSVSYDDENSEGCCDAKSSSLTFIPTSKISKSLHNVSVVFHSGNVYTGGFKDYHFHGTGKYRWRDGTTYEGEFRRGLIHGKGTMHYADGSTYTGDFHMCNRSGWGVLTSSNKQSYAGNWENNLPHGKGTAFFDPNDETIDYYDGYWINGSQDGQGIRQYSNGDRYVGSWKNGTREGEGTMIWLAEHQVYTGSWKGGVPHGSGRHTWYLVRTDCNTFPVRNVYVGEHLNGRRDGVGKMIYPCGSSYEGKWKNGQRHGKGVFINPAGDVLIGLFRAGSIIGGSDVPLHSPTYEVDFRGLVDHLTFKLGLKVENENHEEDNLTYITTRFLGQIRQLYSRAGNFAHSYGDNGVFPSWKKNFSKQCSDPILQKKRQADHPEANIKKQRSPDNVHPVTRFGLWLLLMDCPDLLYDVTMADYDQLWGQTSSVSFQTPHNPFEPVYLWQFLQCLILVAVKIYIEMPERKGRMNGLAEFLENVESLSNRESYSAPKLSSISLFENNGVKAANSLDAKSNADLNTESKLSMKHRNFTTAPRKTKGSVKSSSDEEKRHPSISHDLINKSHELKSQPEPKDGTPLHRKKSSNTSDGQKKKTAEQLELPDSLQPAPRKCEMGISEAFETLLIEKLIPCLEMRPGANLPTIPKPLPPLEDMYQQFLDQTGNIDTIRAKDLLDIMTPHLTRNYPTLWWHRTSEILSHSVDYESLFDYCKNNLYHKHFEKKANEAVFLSDSIAEEDGLLSLLSNGIQKNEAQANSIFGDAIDIVAHREDKFYTETLPFAESDLLSAPFLWEGPRKCLLTKPSNTVFEKLTAPDIINVFKVLYPSQCGQGCTFSQGFNFNLLFCDWLWVISLSTKLIADRECSQTMLFKNPAMQQNVPVHHHPTPMPHLTGVYAHDRKIQENEILAAPVNLIEIEVDKRSGSTVSSPHAHPF